MEDIKLVVLDVDGTLITHNSWYELNVALGITPIEDRQMYDAYSAGVITYDEWIEKLIYLYKTRGKATKAHITKVLYEGITVTEGAKEMVEALKAKGYELAVTTGSFDIVAEHVADILGIAKRKGNARFIFDENGMFITMEHDGEEKFAKVEYLKVFTQELGISVEQCACVGDGGNDIEIFKLTQHGITFSSSDNEIRQVAWKVVDSLQDVPSVL